MRGESVILHKKYHATIRKYSVSLNVIKCINDWILWSFFFLCVCAFVFLVPLFLVKLFACTVMPIQSWILNLEILYLGSPVMACYKVDYNPYKWIFTAVLMSHTWGLKSDHIFIVSVWIAILPLQSHWSSQLRGVNAWHSWWFALHGSWPPSSAVRQSSAGGRRIHGKIHTSVYWPVTLDMSSIPPCDLFICQCWSWVLFTCVLWLWLVAATSALFLIGVSFYKYTGRSVSRTGSESRTTHEISGNISCLNGVRADCEETELSCDATALIENHAEDSKLVHFAPQISESIPTQSPHDVEADTTTTRPPNGTSGHNTQGISQLKDDIVTKSRIGEHHTKSFNNGSTIARTSDRQSKRLANRLRISLRERACKTEKEKAAERAATKENKAAKNLAVVVGGFVACWMPFHIIYTIEPFL